MKTQILIFGMFLLGLHDAVSSADQKSSLTFVIDDTGSMQIDLHEVNKTVSSIFNSVYSEKSHIDDFVVVTFNDPEVKLRNNGHNRSDFENALRNIEPRGGGNCAEMSMSGLQLGLENSRPGSLMWVFTDASAADMEKYSKVEELSQKMGSQVYVAITGICDNRTDPDYMVYRDLALATNGQVFHLRKNQIGKLFNYVDHLIKDRKDIVTSKIFAAGSHNTIPVNVDDDMRELIIAVSGYKPVVTLTNTAGVVATQVITRVGEIAIVKAAVEPGKYNVYVGSQSETHVVISASTDVHFEHGFSVFTPTNIKATTRKPVPGKLSYLSIKLATVDPKDLELRSVQILDMGDNVLLEEPLKLVNNATQLYATSKISPPDHMFKIAVKLYDTFSKTNLTRHGLTPIKPQNGRAGKSTPQAPVVTIEGSPSINAAFYFPLQIICKAKGYPPLSVIWTSSDKSANFTYDKQMSIFELPDEYISVLDIPEVKNNATYTCTATNAEGTNKATVSVQTHTNIEFIVIKSPHNASIEYLKSGRMTCKVKAFPAVKVSWNKNGQPLIPDGNIVVSEDGSILTIRSMEPYMTDNYNCLVKNDVFKQVFPFKLNISGISPPFIIRMKPNITAIKHSKKDLNCLVTECIPKPIISWWYKDVNASEYTSLNITTDTIHFDSVNDTHAGTYVCLAENIAGSDSTEMQLKVIDKCKVPVVENPCKSAIKNWYYDSENKVCLQFRYGRCSSNENNFESEVDCESECDTTPKPVTTLAPPKILGKCEQPKVVGPCRAAYPRWYYDTKLKECRKFVYGGCQKNDNNFMEKDDCEAACVAPTPPAIVTTLAPRVPPSISKINPKITVMKNTEKDIKCLVTAGTPKPNISWWYNDGIESEYNRLDITTDTIHFDSVNATHAGIYSCLAVNDAGSDSHVIVLNVVDKCKLPVEAGPCRSALTKWYYDSNLKTCRQFKYGGCPVNENKFESEENCRNECVTAPGPETQDDTAATTTLLGKCEQPKVVGRCPGSLLRWYYDSKLKECRKFVYSGCEKNDNNFIEKDDCEAACVAPTPPALVTTLAPRVPPTILKINPNITVMKNSETDIKCLVTAGTPKPDIRWWYKDRIESEYNRLDKTTDTIHFDSVNATHAGIYSCLAVNDAGSDSHVIVLNVVDKCKLPAEAGPCRAALTKWYYDSNLKTCRQFKYGGCPVNENNFASEENCRNECVTAPGPETQDDTAATTTLLGKCEQPKVVGRCPGSLLRWYYDSKLKECRKFVYSGCEKNDNNFIEKDDCEAACVAPTPPAIATTLAPRVPPTILKINPNITVMKNSETDIKCLVTAGTPKPDIRWWYKDRIESEYNRLDKTTDTIHFDSVNATHAGIYSCLAVNDAGYDSHVIVLNVVDKCKLPAEAGPCRAALTKWYYDSNLKTCSRFVYGGCGGNENNFESEVDCHNKCITAPESVTLRTTPAPKTILDMCQLPMEVGPCPYAFRKWYYDSGLKTCRRFIYGGCNGNANQFDSEEDCRAVCPPTRPTPVTVTTPAPIDKCQLPVEVGPCQSSLLKWYYDSGLKSCRRFIYGGCNGNANQFDSEENCRAVCPPTRPTPVTVTTPAPIDKCQLPMEVGPCQASLRKWYYDSGLKSCRRFIYGGCNGNANQFDSEEDCRAVCPPTRPTPVTVTTPAPIDKCQLPVEVGPCQSSLLKWYYDSGLKSCRRFIYGGCNGNANQFDSEEDCRAVCPPTRPTPVTVTTPAPIDKCQLPMEVGPCQASLRKWYYDSGLKSCRRFIYGGCNGNANQFDSEEDCRAVCPPTRPTPVTVTTPAPIDKCQLPVEVGPCQSSLLKWYYDSGLKSCRRFIYGGCNGNANQFDSEEDCRAVCPPTRPTPVTVTTPAPIDKCQLPVEVGPCQSSLLKWYYDSGLKSCRRFIYGGCNGNANQFDSEEDCRAVCPPTRPTPVTVTTPAPIDKCQLPMEVGPCQASLRKWYYDSGLKSCRRFIYGGCNGNANQFDSEEDCRAVCPPTRPTPVTVTTPAPIDKCQLPVDVGSCQGAFRKWYFDSGRKECRRFDYSGCHGNENRFNTFEDCRAQCDSTASDQVASSHSKGCFLNIKQDLNGNNPLMLTKNDEFTNFETSDGYLQIPRNETIKLVCPRKFHKMIFKEIIVSCDRENQFLLQPSGSPFVYSDLKCNEGWQYKVVKTGRKCSNTDSELLNVGFEIRDSFREIYQVCLNRMTNNPIYTKQNLIQTLPNAVSNKDTAWFDNEVSIDLDITYDCGSQNKEISRILNKEFHRDGCCFAKRMLVNPHDVAVGLPQAASYSYLNVAPHWSSCNSQNWEEIEQRIRDLRRKSGRPLLVWTGVAEQLQIHGVNSELKNITLSQSGKEFQVPTYFWKVVQDSGSKASLAIIQVNVPDLKMREAHKYLKCPDVCKKTKWMYSGLWRDLARGYTYCCSLDTFKSAFQLAYYGALPTSHELLLDVTNLPNNVV